MWIALALLKFFPAMVANGIPVLLAKLPFSQPISSRLFGRGKTWKGLIGGSLAAGLTAHLLSGFIPELNLLVGTCLGSGALLGDLVKSYFKRKLAIRGTWFPFDQLDWIFGAYAFSLPFHLLSFAEFLTILPIGLALHLATNKLAIVLKLKDKL